MAFSGVSGLEISGKGMLLQVRPAPTFTGTLPVVLPAIPGTGFETLPPLPLSTGIFRFLKALELKSIGVKISEVPFHGGWELIEWKPTMVMVVEIIDHGSNNRGFGEEGDTQFDLNLGVDETIFDEVPPVEIPGIVPTVVVEEEEDNFWVVTNLSVGEMTRDQAEGTGAPVPEEAEKPLTEEAVGTGEPVLEVDRSGEAPDLMEEDTPVRTGGDDLEKARSARADLGLGEGDLRIEDFPQDVFDKVGDLDPEEQLQTTPVSGSKQSAQSPTETEPRRKRIKIPAGRTDLPRVGRLQALQARGSSSAPQATRPSRRSHRLIAQGIRSRPVRRGAQVIEEISSSSEGSPTRDPAPVEEQLASPDLASEQASTEHTPDQPAASRGDLKRKAKEQSTPATHPTTKPSAKRAKTELVPSAKLEKFQKRGVVRGKLVKKSYFQDQQLGVFLDLLRDQGWLELFANTQMGCSQPDVAEFYANVTLHGDVISSTVNGVLIEVDAQALGVILGVPSTGFALYIREDKSLLGRDRLVELSRHLSQQPGLRSPQAVKKGDMRPLHQLLFWFIIKNVIPRAQGRNQADAMDQCLIDLMDRGEQINLPAFMITHIMRIATTTRAHDLGYGFLLTKVFEHFGVELRKKVEAQVIDEIGSSTLLGCGYDLIKAGDQRKDQEERSPRSATAHRTDQEVRTPRSSTVRRREQAEKTPSTPAPSAAPSQPAAPSPDQDQGLRADLSALQRELQEEKELNAKRHADLLALLQALQPKPTNP